MFMRTHKEIIQLHLCISIRICSAILRKLFDFFQGTVKRYTVQLDADPDLSTVRIAAILSAG